MIINWKYEHVLINCKSCCKTDKNKLSKVDMNIDLWIMKIT